MRFAFSECFCDEGTAARTEHEAERAEDHEEGHDKVDGGEGGLPHEIRNKKAVHDAVDRGEDHHNDRGERESQQLSVVKVVG